MVGGEADRYDIVEKVGLAGVVAEKLEADS